VAVGDFDNAVCGTFGGRRQHEEAMTDAEGRQRQCGDGGERAEEKRAIVIRGFELGRA
jgi:hypothetical protein